MPFCPRCGAKADDGTRFCTVCGARFESGGEAAKTNTQSASDKVSAAFDNFKNTSDFTADFERSDIEANKSMAFLAYCSWLVLIPLLSARNSEFAKFHTNQGLILAIAEVLWMIVFRIIRKVFSFWLMNWLFGYIGFIATAVFIFFSVFGAVNALNGDAKELPIIGSVRIIK